MSRLIDAEQFMTEMEINIGNIYNPDIITGMRFAIDLIKSRPTAYDVEKVVVELHEQWNDISCIDDDMYCIGVANGLAKAIDIVKRGGVE